MKKNFYKKNHNNQGGNPSFNKNRENVLDIYSKNNGGTIKYITPYDIQKMTIRIFKDMANGSIDAKSITEKYLDFFSSMTTLDNMKVVIDQKLYDSRLKFTALDFFFANDPEGQREAATLRGTELIRTEYSLYCMYKIMDNILSDALAHPEDAIRILLCVQYNLNGYRQFFNKLV